MGVRAVVSTSRATSAFIRADLGLEFFGAAQQAEQMESVTGSSSPAGLGTRRARASALFRYTSSCGVVYMATPGPSGYVQWAAATADGTRSDTTTLNIPAPKGALLRQLGDVQAKAVCALLGK